MEKITPFKELNQKQKLQYIWDYYKWPIIIAIIAIWIITSTVKTIVSHVEPELSIIMINSDSTKDETDLYDFFDAKDIKTYDGIINLSNTMYFGQHASSTSYNDYAVLMTFISAGEEDIFFGYGDTYDDYTSQGIFTDLSTIFDEEFLSSYDVLYSTAEGTVEEYPAAIKLPKEANICQKGYYPDGDVYVGILYNAPHREMAIEFLKYAMEH